VPLKLDKNFPNPRFQVENVGYINLLIIRNVSKEDEATYLCQAGAAYNLAFVNGTNLIIYRPKSVKVSHNEQLANPTGSETLQCSVLSDSNITTCSGDPSVFWFRSRSEKSFPDMIYTDGKKSENCKKRSDSPKRCFYNFYKNISSSDAGTYYCAVATCGQIIFGNEIKNAVNLAKKLGGDGFNDMTSEDINAVIDEHTHPLSFKQVLFFGSSVEYLIMLCNSCKKIKVTTSWISLIAGYFRNANPAKNKGSLQWVFHMKNEPKH
uniref:Ig-like domain-containing protein n=1 Tax=Poecilia mexicana TaxID=48701 RepID=A0A3B3YKQ7_9TELE